MVKAHEWNTLVGQISSLLRKLEVEHERYFSSVVKENIRKRQTLLLALHDNAQFVNSFCNRELLQKLINGTLFQELKNYNDAQIENINPEDQQNESFIVYRKLQDIQVLYQRFLLQYHSVLRACLLVLPLLDEITPAFKSAQDLLCDEVADAVVQGEPFPRHIDSPIDLQDSLDKVNKFFLANTPEERRGRCKDLVEIYQHLSQIIQLLSSSAVARYALFPEVDMTIFRKFYSSLEKFSAHAKEQQSLDTNLIPPAAQLKAIFLTLLSPMRQLKNILAIEIELEVSPNRTLSVLEGDIMKEIFKIPTCSQRK